MKHLIFILVMLSNNLVLFGQYEVRIDSSFGNNGIVALPYGVASQKQGIFLQSDGKMILMGKNKTNANELTIMRLNTNGTLDSSYNNTGINNDTTLFSEWHENIGLLMPNNEFIVGGYDKAYKKTLLYKYRDNGTIDNFFGDNGVMVFPEDTYWRYLRSLTRYDDSSFLALITGHSKNTIKKININGQIDSSFSINGTIEILDASFVAEIITLSPDGSIYISATKFASPTSYSTVLKFNPNLTIDTGFQFQGQPGVYPYVLGLDQDAKVIVGLREYGSKVKLWRLMANGALDSSFSKDGILYENLNFYYPLWGNNMQMIEQPDGKLLFSATGNGAKAFRVNPNGTMDYSFNLSGTVQLTSLIYAPTFDTCVIAYQSDGKIVFMTETASEFIQIIRIEAMP